MTEYQNLHTSARLQCCSRTSGAFISRIEDLGPARHSSHHRRYAGTVEEAKLPEGWGGGTHCLVVFSFSFPSRLCRTVIAGSNIKLHHYNAKALPESQARLLLGLNHDTGNKIKVFFSYGVIDSFCTVGYFADYFY